MGDEGSEVRVSDGDIVDHGAAGAVTIEMPVQRVEPKLVGHPRIRDGAIGQLRRSGAHVEHDPDHIVNDEVRPVDRPAMDLDGMTVAVDREVRPGIVAGDMPIGGEVDRLTRRW